ncbi:TonB-dependent hemoglobin/transferrin/lactoferrin family receptor [Caulobacter sp. NIBR1757]|uniref:TonB-dependent hemoglobin/transferrin/lactoferrin family receptor n=1 Tax=Caulobacter sp. NIBR1757 TaxID=3016000 RepID=UPI0022F09657|nr:TonB-dependent hemoglobin/transferrin/lactoferrin family receptor [Caulobacter sp. NIBR1757]WGM37597.1 Hemin receptor [Caulobacter sp. NIBR1757]
MHKNFRRSALAVSLLAIAVAAPAFGAEGEEAAAVTEVSPVSVVATRTEKAADETPASVSVITAGQIEDWLATDIKDLVRYEPGVVVRTSPARFGAALGTGGRDGNSGFNIRGLEGNRVLILVDGVRTPDAFSFGAQNVGRGDFSDLSLMKRVEILRGPGSALYGSDGVAGVVSFTTKDPDDFLRAGRGFAVQGTAQHSSADEGLSTGVVGAGQFGDWGLMLAYNHREASETETQGSNNVSGALRDTANPTSIESDALLAKVTFAPNDRHSFRLTAETYEREVITEVLSGRSASVLDLDGDDTTTRDRVAFDWRYTGEGLVSSAFVAAYWQNATTEQFTAEDRDPAADRTRLNTFDNEVWGLSAEAHSSFGAHRLTYGADVSFTTQEGIRDGTVPPFGETFPTRAFPVTDYTLAGVYIQDEIVLLDGRVTLFPALRADYYDLEPKNDASLPAGFVGASQSDSHLSPKFGAVWKLGAGWSLYGNYAEGFKAPAPSQVNNSFVNLGSLYTSIPNPDLKPETSRTFEAGLRWSNDRVFLGFTAFTGDYEDFIEQAQVGGSFTPGDLGVFQYVNIGSVEISGWEVTGRADLGAGFSANLAAAWAEGEGSSGGAATPLASIEPFKVVAGLTWREAGGRFGGQFNLTHGAGKDEDKAGVTCSPSCFIPGQYTTADLTGWVAIGDVAVIRAGVFNLTDEKYWNWSDVRGVASTSLVKDAYTPPGRNYGVSLTLRY